MAKYYGEKKMKGNGFANLPEKEVMKEYPKAQYGSVERYNDRIDGIDMLAKDNAKKMAKKPGGRH